MIKANAVSKLQNWPVQIKLAPVNAPYFNGANLLIAADCTAYAYAGFHQDFIRNKVTLIGCPKCDNCKNGSSMLWWTGNGGKKALQSSGKFLPWQVITISIYGNIIE